MTIELETINCKNGNEYILKALDAENAEQFLDFMRQVSVDTHFMSRYSDEVGQTPEEIEAERSRLKAMNNDPRQGMLSIFDENEIIANIAIRSVGRGRKTAHRCSIGIGVRKEFHGLGLGTILMERTIEAARKVGYECIELGVLSDNKPAYNMYRKMGFKEWGRLSGAFRLDDGTAIDEIAMYRHL